MKLFFIILVILLILFTPIPIKFSIYYSAEDYYIKLYKITILSKKKADIKKKKKDNIKEDEKENLNLLSVINKYINLKSFLKYLYNSNFKPLLKIKSNLDYSFSDAARTSISYGILCQVPSLIFLVCHIPFNVIKFNFKINPIFEDKLLLKFETSSIFFLSIAHIIYITIILFKYIRD